MKDFKNLILIVASLLVCLLIFEIGARFFVAPSEECYGVFFGHKLPPLKVIMYNPYRDGHLRIHDNNWWKNIVVDGKKITLADLRGSYREDGLLGYTPEENFLSPNGWWQTNNLGARSRDDIAKYAMHNKKRIIIFGESFTDCIGLRQEEAWPTLLNNKSENIEVINFGVGGYSMTQCFLRYKKIINEINYDTVIFVFSPSINLWREISVVRYLGGGWTSHNTPSPRFIIEKGKLKLIKIPWGSSMNSFYEKNRETLSEEFKDHLRKYDRFYFKAKYEDTPIIGKSIIFKLIIEKYYNFKNEYLFANLMEPSSEAMQISKRIFAAIRDETRRSGKEFILVFYPPPRDLLRNYKKHASLRKLWKDTVSFFSKEDLVCIDLMNNFLMLPESKLDMDYDGSHYGKRVNKLIAELIWDNLNKLGYN